MGYHPNFNNNQNVGKYPNTGANPSSIGWSPHVTNNAGKPPITNSQHVGKSNSWGTNSQSPAKPPVTSNFPNHAPSAPKLPSAPATSNIGWKVTPTNTGGISHGSRPVASAVRIQIAKMPFFFSNETIHSLEFLEKL